TPDLGGSTEYWNIFGYHVSQTNYAYQVIPVLAAVWILSILEKSVFSLENVFLVLLLRWF
ncbi:hypothetical protein, partial [Enterococcus faecium]|uniref:hypothetical protein n=1 Tax=Enterococcus faecium TaxID=1352 RepID=UPI00292D88F1